MIETYLKYRPAIWNKIIQISGVSDPQSDDLINNDKLSICMCRVRYRRVKDPIPSDLFGWARFWKKHYNTYLGKGTEAEFIKNYHRYVKVDENSVTVLADGAVSIGGSSESEIAKSLDAAKELLKSIGDSDIAIAIATSRIEAITKIRKL